MPLASDQWRLLWAAAMVGVPLFAGYRLARKIQPAIGAICDAILIAYLVQYASVGIAGLLGILTPASLTVFGFAISGGLLFAARRIKGEPSGGALASREQRWLTGGFLGAAGFVAALVFAQRLQPPLATDAITYHLPAAVLWLQKKRLAIFQVWFFNPANTFSPLAGSMFDLWLLAPMGNDSLARFVQLGPWILIFFSVVRLARSAGAQMPAAALAGLATVLSRPFIGECSLPMDDLFVAAFVLAAVCALLPQQSRGRFGAVRLGIAIGLMLAVKYTAVMMLPLLLLAVDRPIRAGWRWRRWGAAFGCAALVAGPWYLRNLVLFHNPLFPLKLDFLGVHLPGLFSSVHVKAFENAGGAWEILSGGYLGMPTAVFVFAGLTWVAMLIRSGRTIWIDPSRRVIALGPLIGIALFVLFSPQAEVRFVFPAFALLFVPSAILARGRWGTAIAALGLIVALSTGFASSNASEVIRFTMVGIIVALLGLIVRWIESDLMRWRKPAISVACLAGVLVVLCFGWSGYVDEYRQARSEFWGGTYPTHSPLWSFVDEHIPAGATIAYSNQFMVYPLFGFEYTRHLVYAPVRDGARVANLAFPARLGDGEFFIRSMDAANSPADLAAWKRNLKQAGAEYLLVGVGKGAPEIAWAQSDPVHFRKIFANEQAVVYRIEGLE